MDNIKIRSWYKVKNKRGYAFLRSDPTESGYMIERLFNTYNVQAIDEQGDMVKVFSPDLNCDGWMKKEDVAENVYYQKGSE